MVVPWLGGAVVGVLAGEAIPAAWRGGVDLVGPLIFLSLLVPLLRTRRAALVAGIAGALALLGAATLPGASYLLLAGFGGALVGALLEGAGRRTPPFPRRGGAGVNVFCVSPPDAVACDEAEQAGEEDADEGFQASKELHDLGSWHSVKWRLRSEDRQTENDDI